MIFVVLLSVYVYTGHARDMLKNMPKLVRDHDGIKSTTFGMLA